MPRRYGRARRRRGRLLLVLLVAAAVAAALIAKSRLDSNRGYSTTDGATLVHYSLDSTLVGHSLDEIGVVPPGAGSRPLLVLLHGRHDPPRGLSWLIHAKSGPESMLTDALFGGLARLGARAPVVVLLNGGGHSYYHDRRDGRWASMILNEAIPDAIRRFHTSATRIAIGGISMGGYGALHVAALRPTAFCAVGGHSAALWESGGASPPGAFDDAADFERNDVFAAARAGRYAHLPVWIDGGTRDPFHDADAEFVSLLRAHGVDVAYHVWPGAHTGAYWNAHMAAYLRFYAIALARCRRFRS